MRSMHWHSNIPEGQSGDWRVERFVVGDNDFQAAILNLKGRGLSPGEYTRLVYLGNTIMSDTPAEKSDHRYVYYKATGRVLLNGLGLGVFLDSILKKTEVKSVTVIETSEDVIQLVAPHFNDSRVEIIQADAIKWRPKNGERFNCVWHDIWADICSDNLSEMHFLHRAYGRRCDWQGSWSRDALK